MNLAWQKLFNAKTFREITMADTTPSAAELIAALGPAAATTGMVFIVKKAASPQVYIVTSTGTGYFRSAVLTAVK